MRNRIHSEHHPLLKRLTPLSLIFGFSPWYSKEHITRNKLADLLIENDSHLSGPLKGEDFDPLVANFYVKHPEIAEERGFCQLCLAVIRRSESELQILLDRGESVRGSSNCALYPLYFAVGWPFGMRTLLDAGADPSMAIHFAVDSVDFEAVKLLFEFECPLFVYQNAPESFWYSYDSDSILAYASRNEYLFSIIAGKVASYRCELLTLALDILPPSQLKKLGVFPGRLRDSVLDYGAEAVANAICRRGIRLKPKLWPGTYSTVYHLYMWPHDDVKLKDILWANGFHDHDAQDRWGATPLLRACCLTISRTSEFKWQSMMWHLNRGADPLNVGTIGLPNCLHALAHAINRKPTTQWHRDRVITCYVDSLPLDSVKTDVVCRLNNLCGANSRDSCSCYCSSLGCLSSTVLLKSRNGNAGWENKKRWLGVWLQLSGLSEQQQQVHYRETCRLEIFERLGMAHTCCRFQIHYQSPHKIPWLRFLGQEEQLNLQAEDEELKTYLETYLELYDRLLGDFIGHFQQFWDGWWTALEACLPGIESKLEFNEDTCSWHWVEDESDRDETGSYVPDEKAIRRAFKRALQADAEGFMSMWEESVPLLVRDEPLHA